MSSSDVAIRVENVSKHYLMFARPEDRLKQMVVPKLQRLAGRAPKQFYRDFAALTGISFEVKRGETVGIIGRNGCGKSTLLQIVCGTLQPTTGSVTVNGRIAALLELGAGFNPEFTGRENVYLNAAILGLARAEIDARFDAIAAFADIGQFIDQPVKTYSSGMYVRLAFAVAINVEPDILVVDEALAVGDEAFQRKCFARIEDIKAKGGTILFVSHGAQTIVQLCDRAILLDGGEKLLDGRPKTVVSQYQRLANLSGAEAIAVRTAIKAMGDGGTSPSINVPRNNVTVAATSTAEPSECASTSVSDQGAWFDPSLTSHSRVDYESQGAVIRDVRLTTLDGAQVNVLRSGARYIYQYRVDFSEAIEAAGFGMLIKTVTGTELGGAATDFERRLLLDHANAGSSYRVRFDVCWSLTPGTYFLNAGVTGTRNGSYAYSHRLLDALSFRIMPTTERIATGLVDFGAVPRFEEIAAGDPGPALHHQECCSASG